MQIAYVAGVKKRFTYYLAKAYANQIERGEDYPKLNEVIFIGILDFILFKRKRGYLSRHQILDTQTHRREFKDLELNFIELPKFTKQEHEIQSVLEKWVYFIKHAEDLQVVPGHVIESSLQMAYAEADQFGWSEADLEAYEYRGMRIQDERGALVHAREEGRAEGLAAGRQEGEQAKAMETARKMRQEGLDLALIAKITGLEVSEIERL
jgi:predicted transposase/invertase (TIGR01784 family)